VELQKGPYAYEDSDYFRGLNTVWQAKKQKQESKRVRMAVLGPFCCFGNEEIIQNIPRRCRAICAVAGTEIFSVARDVPACSFLNFLSLEISRKFTG
jgi:hypothetical protein